MQSCEINFYKDNVGINSSVYPWKVETTLYDDDLPLKVGKSGEADCYNFTRNV